MVWVCLIVIFLHIIFLFGAVVLSKVAEAEDIIDDAEFPMTISIFLPLGVIVFISAIWVGELVSDKLTVKKFL